MGPFWLVSGTYFPVQTLTLTLALRALLRESCQCTVLQYSRAFDGGSCGAPVAYIAAALSIPGGIHRHVWPPPVS